VSIGPAFKGGWGFHPLMAWRDKRRAVGDYSQPGNAGSNTAANHIAIIVAAVARSAGIKIAQPLPLASREHSHAGEISRGQVSRAS
jgi:hypothetical protein